MLSELSKFLQLFFEYPPWQAGAQGCRAIGFPETIPMHVEKCKSHLHEIAGKKARSQNPAADGIEQRLFIGLPLSREEQGATVK